MRNTIVKAALAALVMSSPLAATEALAKYKVKEMKFHVVTGAHENPVTMVMEKSGGKWNWVNKNETFKPRMKVFFKVNKKSEASVSFDKMGLVWQTPVGYSAKKYEKLITLNMGKSHLSGFQHAAAQVCDVFGGSKQVVRDFNINGTYQVIRAKPTAEHKNKAVKFPIKIACKSTGPTRNPKPAQQSSMKLKQLKMYTIPARPKCGKPVKMVAEFHTTSPGKVDFLYYRDDGENQKASVTTSKGGKGFVKRWAKTYTFKKTTKRKYKIVAIGHKAATPWIPLTVRCDHTNGLTN